MVAKKRYFLFTLCLMAGSGCICITFASMEFSYLVGDDFRLLQVSVLSNRELSVLEVHGKCD